LQRGDEHRPAPFQDIGTARGIGEDVDQPRRIQTQRRAQRQRLAERLPEHQQRQIDRKFHAGARADRADVLDAAAHLIEHRFRARDIGRFAADEAEKLAVLRRADRPAHRTFDQRRALAPHLLGQRPFDLRPHRAHLDEQLALNLARQQSARAMVGLLDRLRVAQDGDDQFRLSREFRRGCHHLHAGRCQRARLVGAAVPHRDLVTETR